MEIQNPKPLGDPSKTASREASREAVRRGIESLERAKEAHRQAFEDHVADSRSHGRKDRVDLSERARLFADDSGVDADRAGGEVREQRIAELRTHVRNGTLYTPERTEGAARRMLGG